MRSNCNYVLVQPWTGGWRVSNGVSTFPQLRAAVAEAVENSKGNDYSIVVIQHTPDAANAMRVEDLALVATAFEQVVLPTIDARDLFYVHPAGLEIDFSKCRALVQGACVPLSKHEVKLLSLLAAAKGQTVSHEILSVALWGPAHRRNRQYLRVLVLRLRKKLGASPALRELLRSHKAQGYSLATTGQTS